MLGETSFSQDKASAANFSLSSDGKVGGGDRPAAPKLLSARDLSDISVFQERESRQKMIEQAIPQPSMRPWKEWALRALGLVFY
ncbi:hypothetical protein U1Q18_003000 [Sarracenia purpurea var. burkii]